MAITWLNNAILFLSRKHDFRDLEATYSASTVASQKGYSTPTNTSKIYAVTIQDDTNSRKLICITQQHFDKVVPRPEAYTTGRPTWYIEFGSHIDLYPIPDAVYTMYMRVYLSPTIVTATTDTISYTPDKDDIIAAYMTKEAFQHYQMFEDALLWKKDFDEKLKYAILTDEEQPDNPPVARGFDSNRATPEIGEPWNSPFVWRRA